MNVMEPRNPPLLQFGQKKSAPLPRIGGGGRKRSERSVIRSHNGRMGLDGTKSVRVADAKHLPDSAPPNDDAIALLEHPLSKRPQPRAQPSKILEWSYHNGLPSRLLSVCRPEYGSTESCTDETAPL